MNVLMIRVPQATKRGYLEVAPGGLFDLSYPSSKNRRGRVQGEHGEICPAITSMQFGVVLYEGVYEEE